MDDDGYVTYVVDSYQYSELPILSGAYKGYRHLSFDVSGSDQHRNIRIYAQDTYGVRSQALSFECEVEPVQWSRTIEAGSVIADRTTSHKADIQQILDNVNVLRANAGMQAVSYPGTVGYFADWAEQMNVAYQTLKSIYETYGYTVGVSVNLQVGAYPTAASINTIRKMIEGVLQ